MRLDGGAGRSTLSPPAIPPRHRGNPSHDRRRWRSRPPRSRSSPVRRSAAIARRSGERGGRARGGHMSTSEPRTAAAAAAARTPRRAPPARRHPRQPAQKGSSPPQWPTKSTPGVIGRGSQRRHTPPTTPSDGGFLFSFFLFGFLFFFFFPVRLPRWSGLRPPHGHRLAPAMRQAFVQRCPAPPTTKSRPPVRPSVRPGRRMPARRRWRAVFSAAFSARVRRPQQHRRPMGESAIASASPAQTETARDSYVPRSAVSA